MRTLAFVPILFALLTQGQCSLSGSGVFNWIICGDPGTITVQLVNGTPPYHLQTTSGIWPDVEVQGHSSSVFELDLDWGGHYPSGNSSFWSVTDAMGCTTQFVVQNINSLQSGMNLLRAVNCTVGTTSNAIEIVYSACGSSTYTYSIYGQGGLAASGQLGSLPLIGPNTYALPPLPDDAYTLHLSEGYGQCGQFEFYDCWQPWEFTHVNMNIGDCGVNFRLRAALGGALPSGILMTDGLRTANLVPASQPYTALGYTFVGSPINVSVAPALLAVTGNDAIVDWVVVELRSSPTTVVYSKPVLLQRDGDVIDSDGGAYLNFPVSPGAYHIAIRHRNHLGAMTYSAWNLTLDPASTLIDLRLASTFMYGINARVLKGSIYCLWPGDANFNGTVKYAGSANDRDPILTLIGGATPTSTVNNVYNGADLNLDGTVKYAGSANDRDIILQTIGGSVPTATRTQQLP